MSILTVKELASPSGFDLKLATGETLDLNSQGTVVLPTIPSDKLPTIPSSKMPTGSVLQVVGYISTAQVSQTTTTADQAISDIFKPITPLGNNSNFLVNIRWFGETNNHWEIMWNIHMDNVRVNAYGNGVGHGLFALSSGYNTVNNDSTPNSMNFQTLVKHATAVPHPAGTAITFKLVTSDNSAGSIIWTNRCFGSPSTSRETGTSEIIITEIAG